VVNKGTTQREELKPRRRREKIKRDLMRKLGCGLIAVLLVVLSACTTPSTRPLEGVAVSKVINQIKQDLAASSVADIKVGDGSQHACGDDPNKPLVLMRSPDVPIVTLKLSTVRVIDVTGDAEVSKLPVLGVLFSVDASYENKRAETVEQDLSFAIVRPTTKAGDPLLVVVPQEKYSELGRAINEAELGILGADHEFKPCLQPTKLSVNVLVDVTRTVGANGTVGFLLLYSVTAKTSVANELKNQIQVDITYDKTSAAAFK
jgi:hypothetical protein